MTEMKIKSIKIGKFHLRLIVILMFVLNAKIAENMRDFVYECEVTFNKK